MLLCIGAYIEAAIYSSTEITLHTIGPIDHNHKLLRKLYDEYGKALKSKNSYFLQSVSQLKTILTNQQ